ncbi:hypothetical protein [Rhodanobacter sp. DHG33]|uniref:hypothetical protein n=1 Tax=Rhodanobacter sp. DHG33 TaxID=2775921 RepID=UPI00178531B1|nr:hypothetical protein [Rhodanobacter sp. DHG33]MBD8899008.1 hypothetical protein [Rhodanobacter sp. DHG33]
MSRSPFLRSTALSVGLGMAAACMALPAFAATPDTVTFPANSVWAQEIGKLDHDGSSYDYAVAVATGKTLQIKLISNNANAYFKVTDQGSSQEMVDSHKTGASNWSTPIAAAGTYTIQVYLDPDAVKREETAKYALQIGEYGAEDLRPPTTAVTFQPNKPWAEQDGSLAAGAAAHDFTVSIAAGMTVSVNLVSKNPQVHFKVQDATPKQLVDSSTTGSNTWSAPASTAATTYTIEVYADPTALPSGQQAPFALQVGQFPAGAQPAGATTAAPPAAAGSAVQPSASK